MKAKVSSVTASPACSRIWAPVVTHALYLKNNQSFTASDFYVEQADGGYVFQGDDDDPPGRVTLQSPKLQMLNKTQWHTISGITADKSPSVPCSIIASRLIPISCSKARPRSISSWPDAVSTAPNWHPNNRRRAPRHAGQPLPIDSKLEGAKADDNYTPDTLQKLSPAFDDLRTLGALDLRLNHPEALSATRGK